MSEVNNHNVFLTIVIACYNVMDYIERCVDSILAQNIDGVEVIIVNDGSTDGVELFLDIKYAHLPNVKLINQDNGGLSSARNAGIAIANGEYLAVLDGDDELNRGCLLKAISCLQKNKPDILMVDYIKSWLDGGLYFNEVGSTLPKNEVLDIFHDDVLSAIYDGSELYPWRFIVRSDIYKTSPFEEGFVYEDIRNIPLLISKGKSFFHLPLIFLTYNQRPGSVMKTKSSKNIMDLSSSTRALKKNLQMLRIPRSAMISHDVFSMKVFVWSVKDFIILGGGDDVINVLKVNMRDSLFGGDEAIKKLKILDKQNYRLYKVFSNKFMLRLLFKLGMNSKILISLRKIYRLF